MLSHATECDIDTCHCRVLRDIIEERGRQDKKWGIQNHPNGTAPWNSRQANYYRDLCDQRAHSGQVSWFDILLEEVWEAGAEIEDGKLREELVQVAAVCAAWIEDIDRRSANARP